MGNSRLTQALRRAVQIRGSGIGVSDGRLHFTWSEVAERIARLAGAFVSLGLARGGRVALLALNSHRSLEAFYAAIHAGGAIVPLNHRLEVEELALLVSDCAPDVFIIGREFVDRVEALRAAAPRSCRFVCIEEADGLLSYEKLVGTSDPLSDAGCADDDLACIFYTSGTTDLSKGVMLSHANLNANTANVLAQIRFDEETVHLHHGPLFHVAAAARLFSVTHVAGRHVFLPRFVAREAIDTIARARVTVATFVPTMLRAMLDEPTFADADLSSLSLITYGGAPMPEALLREVMAALPHVRFAQSYGMTELSPVATMLGSREHEAASAGGVLLRSAGRAVTTAEVQVVDAQGRACPVGASGEIVVRGPMVMLGYWNQPEKTADALRGGWMHTGDVGCFDEDGYLFVIDRLKDMICPSSEHLAQLAA